MDRAVFYDGGYSASAPAHNLAEFWDDATSTYTAYDQAGNVISTRPYNADEIAAAQASASETTRVLNTATLFSRAVNALANNATFLGIASPTNAQAVAQIQALTRQVNALIRLAMADVQSTDGT